MWIIRAQRRKTKNIEAWSKVFEDAIFAETALSALKAGLGTRFIKRYFTYLRIEKA